MEAIMRHVLITNDFWPKVGGIQSYLGEIYQRLDPATFMVVTTTQVGALDFDRNFGAPIVRLGHQLLPTPMTRNAMREAIAGFNPDLVVYDPIVPIGALGATLGLPYALIAHGAEVRVPAYLPGLRALLRQSIRHSIGVIAAGGYPAREVCRLVPDASVEIVPPGIDAKRFGPATPTQREQLRQRWMLDPNQDLILFVSRLVPRKGADTLLRAMGKLGFGAKIEAHIVGDGRDRGRLERLAQSVAGSVVFHGRLPESDMVELYQAADLFVFPARNRWFGVEQEGFGIVILEAQACGTPVIIGDSGGTSEALATAGGELLGRGRFHSVEDALAARLADHKCQSAPREAISAEVRARFDYDQLSKAYEVALAKLMDARPRR